MNVIQDNQIKIVLNIYKKILFYTFRSCGKIIPKSAKKAKKLSKYRKKGYFLGYQKKVQIIKSRFIFWQGDFILSRTTLPPHPPPLSTNHSYTNSSEVRTF